MKVENRFVEKIKPVEKKRLLLRREMNDAYSKNYQFLHARKKVEQVLQQLLENPEDLNSVDESKLEQAASTNQQQRFFHFPFFPVSPIILAGINGAQQDAQSKKETSNLNNRLSHLPITNRIFGEVHLKKGQMAFFDKSMDNPIYKKIYQEAVRNYTFQMTMAQNHFRMREPAFSLTA